VLTLRVEAPDFAHPDLSLATSSNAMKSWLDFCNAPSAIYCAGRSCCLSPVNSVVQYLSRRQFVDALQLFRRLLKSDGKLLLGDVIEPDTPMLRHGMTFLGFAWQNGFFLAGLLSLARNVASPYCPLRRPCLLPVGRDAGAAGRQRLPR
jgi:hypothetical protein